MMVAKARARERTGNNQRMRFRQRDAKRSREQTSMPRKLTTRRLSRRTVLAGTAAGAAAALTRFPAPAIAQNAPFKLGLLTVKTGPLAQGGIQMEQGALDRK